jgi:predicted RNA-binding Zn-ribbon protein involved in translation (DUF1610 family)
MTQHCRPQSHTQILHYTVQEMNILTLLTTDYSESVWRWEQQVIESGAEPLPCPKCGRTGFYGPRTRRWHRNYRACRFCGFWQDLDDKAKYCRSVVHGCSRWPHVAGAPYIWWVLPGQRAFTCPYCMAEVRVESAEVNNPYFNRSHPWWKVPQNKSQARYMKFWAQWPMSRGRPYL